MPSFINLTGQKFGRLEVLERDENDKQNKPLWLCRCDCKNEVIVSGAHLKSGNTQSCGCLQREKATKHGHRKNGKQTGFYTIWINMIQRCTNPKHKSYKYYGGRGITVCDEWLIFSNFERDMGSNWKPGLTIERKDKNGNYCEENCKWATMKEQTRNKRNNCYVTYKEKRWLFVELCEEHNMPYGVVYHRYYNYGWTLEASLTTPVGQRRKKS